MNATHAIVPLKPTPEVVENLWILAEAGWPADAYTAAIAESPGAGMVTLAKRAAVADAIRRRACVGTTVAWADIRPEAQGVYFGLADAAIAALEILVEESPRPAGPVVKGCLTSAAEKDPTP